MSQADQPVAMPIESSRAPGKHSSKRAFILVVVLFCAIVAAYFTPIRSWLKSPAILQEHVRSLGNWLYPVAILSFALLVACGVPRLALCGIWGGLVGFWGGLAIGECGTVLGYYCVFMFVRWGGSAYVLHKWPKLQKWADHLKDQGIVGVILLRHMPIHGTLTNLGLGLSGMKQRHFLIGTALGIIPESIVAVLVGTGLMKSSTKEMIRTITIAVIAFILFFFIARYFIKSRKNKPGTLAVLNEQAHLTDPEE